MRLRDYRFNIYYIQNKLAYNSKQKTTINNKDMENNKGKLKNKYGKQ